MHLLWCVAPPSGRSAGSMRNGLPRSRPHIARWKPMRACATRGRPPSLRPFPDPPPVGCVGLVYCAQHYVAELGQRFDQVVGTTRSTDEVTALAARRFGGRAVKMHVFDGKTAGSEVRAAIAAAEA